MPRFARKTASALVLTGAFVAAPAVHADTASGSIENARHLFVQAEADEDAGRWADALDKLHSVGDVKLTAGVRYHIALCEEHLGKLARALADYRAADEQAHGEKARDVLRLVGKPLAALEKRVPRLTVHVVPDLPDATVTLDGEPLPRAEWATPVPVDPGTHRVQASAPDRPPATVVVTLQEQDSTSLEVQLASAPPPSPPPVASAPAPEAPGGSASVPSSSVFGAESPAGARAPAPAPRSHTATIALAGFAVALAAGGVVAYVMAGDEHDRDMAECARLVDAPPNACDPLKDHVRAWDFAALGAWAGAAIAATTAAVLWLAPPGGASATGARVGVGPGTITVEGRF